MRNYERWTLVAVAVLGLLFGAAGPADAKPAYAKAENKSCSFCHVGKTGDKVFTEAGTYYGKHHTLAGFGEKAKAPKAPAKTAAEPAPVPAAPSEAPASAPAATVEAPATPCPCACPHCGVECPKDCPHWHGKDGMPPTMEKMKGHLEEMKQAVSDLRESEKKMESMKEPEAFRAAVLEHLKILDGIQESHLNHMEKMMGAGHHGRPGPPHMHSQ